MSFKPDQDVGALYSDLSGSYEVTKVTVAGTAVSLANKYFIFSSSGVNYYCWYNLDAGGVDPAVAGKTAVPVAIATGDSTSVIATATAVAVNALALVNSYASGSDVWIKADAIGHVTNAGAGNSGFTINVTSQGHPAEDSYPAKAVDSFSNNPSTIS